MTRTREKEHTLNSICEYVGISQQAYHKRLKKEEQKSEKYDFAEKIVIENRKQKSRAGLRSIYYKEKGLACLGVNQFENQMSLRGHALKPYKKHVRTTDSRGDHYKFDNLVSGLEINGENQVIVGDITYYQNITGVYYVFHFVDYYTLEVKGLVGSKNMCGVNSEKCLRQVFLYNGRKKYKYLLIIHTDGGTQYRSHKFQSILRNAQIKPSHARNCLENGLSERENGIIKNHYLIDYHIKNENHLNSVLRKIKHQINHVWPTETLNNMTPAQYAETIRKIDVRNRVVKIIKVVE